MPMPSTRPCTLGRNDSLAGNTENLRLDDPTLSTSSAGRGTTMGIKGPLSREELAKIDAYWRAANYLSVGQIYLYDNPLLKERPTTRPVKRRRRLRQPRPARRLRHRRRRVGDGAAGHLLALQQVPQSGARRRRAADPAPQRLQDRRTDGARAHQPRGARRALSRLRPHAVFRRRRRARDDAPGTGGHARHRGGRDRPDPARGAY